MLLRPKEYHEGEKVTGMRRLYTSGDEKTREPRKTVLNARSLHVTASKAAIPARHDRGS